MQHFTHPVYSYSLVVFQFAALAALLLTGSWLLANPIGLSLQILGILIGVWAVKTLHWHKFNIVPDPKPDAILVKTGPYRWVRHPMYLSILLFFTPLVIAHPSMFRLTVFAVLVITLSIKLHYEETLLVQKYQQAYQDYQATTQKILPWIF